MSLSVRGLSRSHLQGGKRLEILRELDLEVAAAETVAILGRSGSGKSTLLALLGGLDKPDEGEVLLNGHTLKGLNETALARLRASSMGIVFQQFQLVQTLNAWENVMLPAEILHQEGASQKARELLRDVGLAERMNHFPSQLSGGEQQRVAIARALVAGPSVVLADEPTGNLDGETGQQVMDLFFRLVRERGTSLVLVTHDRECAGRCSRILTLEGGRLRP